VATPAPQDFATGACEDADAFERSVDFVDPRFTATRPVAFLGALPDARV
jgi:hypothetical protein